MASRSGAFGVLILAAVGAFFLVPAQGSAQDSLAGSCAYVVPPEWESLFREAEQGSAAAQYNLGLKYANGDGVFEDDAEAVCWYRLAAEQGLATAQSNLGLMYANGDGVPEDGVEAVRWYRLAAEQGLAVAQFNLGLMYGLGEVIPEEFVLAYMWWTLSAAQGNENAQENKIIIEKLMTREQIAEAQRLSREWIETHPRGGGS